LKLKVIAKAFKKHVFQFRKNDGKHELAKGLILSIKKEDNQNR